MYKKFKTFYPFISAVGGALCISLLCYGWGHAVVMFWGMLAGVLLLVCGLSNINVMQSSDTLDFDASTTDAEATDKPVEADAAFKAKYTSLLSLWSKRPARSSEGAVYDLNDTGYVCVSLRYGTTPVSQLGSYIAATIPSTNTLKGIRHDVRVLYNNIDAAYISVKNGLTENADVSNSELTTLTNAIENACKVLLSALKAVFENEDFINLSDDRYVTLGDFCNYLNRSEDAVGLDTCRASLISLLEAYESAQRLVTKAITTKLNTHTDLG